MKEIVKKFIMFLEELTKKLIYTYDCTWGCDELLEEFKEEVEIRKSINKEEFISFAAGVYTFEAAKIGLFITEDTARKMAEEKFYSGKEKGQFDELYNVKGERNERK